MSTLPDDAAARNQYPMADGLLYYFPAALAEVARVSKIGNDQHNPGEPMHWARGKSTDHANKILRHLVDAGEVDTDGTRHTAKLAWRALALLQEEMEAAGAPMARNARLPATLDKGHHVAVPKPLVGKFHVGERVRVTELDGMDRAWTKLREGDLGTVLQDSSCPYVRLDRNVGANAQPSWDEGAPGRVYALHEDQLEPADEPLIQN